MKLRLIKTYEGKVAVEINKIFEDSTELFNFLNTQGFKISLKDCHDDIIQKEVTYTLPLGV